MTLEMQNSSGPTTARWIGLMLAVGALSPPWRTQAVGSWLTMSAPPGVSVESMLLLSDGTVMVQNGGGADWYKLTPDIHGSYINGNWTTLSPMIYTREFYSSAILRDGRVFVAGGETPASTGGNKAEVFDPQNGPNGLWTEIPVPAGVICTSCGSPGFSDSGCVILPNGNVLIAPVKPAGGSLATVIYNPANSTWSAGPTLQKQQNEATWVKLPDDSILTIDPNCCNPNFNPNELNTSERYIPSLNNGQGGWIPDAPLPVPMYNSVSEIGAGLLLPDGRALFIGGRDHGVGPGHTVYYTPSGSTIPGSWTQGPDLLGNGVGWDEPAAMLVNGKVLIQAELGAIVAPGQPQPRGYYELDPNSNYPIGTLTQSPDWGDTAGTMHRMLNLPDGKVLVSYGNNTIRIYLPDGDPVPSGKPTISSITANGDGSYHLTGTKLNGISQGSSLGDDSQMDSNYPLVRLTKGGNVYSEKRYGRTYNWSSTGVRTGITPVTTEFTLPPEFQNPGSYALEVVANGIASDAIFFAGPVWVAFGGADVGDGTYDRPYNTLTRGRDVAGLLDPALILIKGPGSTAETLSFTQRMTILAKGGPVRVGRN